jgi:hypothetical protein
MAEGHGGWWTAILLLPDISSETFSGPREINDETVCC